MEENNIEKQYDTKEFRIFEARYWTNFNAYYLMRKPWERPNPNVVKALIPGSIVKLNFKEGQQVKKGQKVLILEAMKMQNNIVSPVSGTVKKISVIETQSVAKGDILFEIE